jgi:hypothetical protein
VEGMIDASLLAQGQTLATVDDVVYQAVRLVFACHVDEAPALYCSLDDWPSSHAARLAAKDREIAELAALTDRQAQQVLRLSQRLATLEERLKDAPAPKLPQQTGGVEKRIICDHCGKRIWPDLMEKHIAEKHPSAPGAPIQLVNDSPGWRCAARGCSGAFTRDLRDPMFCTQHAVHTNGVETTKEE